MAANRKRSTRWGTSQPPGTDENESDMDSPVTCDRGHEEVELELLNTRGDRPGRILECPKCLCAVLVTPPVLTGTRTERLIRQPES